MYGGLIMKRLLILSALLFSFNGWASNYDGSITCFNASKEIIDLDNLSIDDERLTGNNKYIKYSYKDLFRNIKSGRITIASGTTCNIMYDTFESTGEYDPFAILEDTE